MTGTAIAIIASWQALQAQEIARRTECKLIISSYPQHPTLSEQREYAGCVYKLYGNGEPLTHGDIFAIKVLIVIVLIGACIGYYKSTQDKYKDGLLDAFMFTFFGAILLPILLALVAGIIYAIFYLFTG